MLHNRRHLLTFLLNPFTLALLLDSLSLFFVKLHFLIELLLLELLVSHLDIGFQLRDLLVGDTELVLWLRQEGGKCLLDVASVALSVT